MCKRICSNRYRAGVFIMAALTLIISFSCHAPESDKLKEGFKNPPESARPGVYWYFMDGNLSREGITKDLESMKAAGIGNVLFLEVNVGVPRGKVNFLSDEWQELFKHAVKECERLGIELTLGSGPGWAGSGGPWVNPEQSMRHLVASSTEFKGPQNIHQKLPKPAPKRPYFGEEALTDTLKKRWNIYYEDVAVLAFPSTEKQDSISDTDEKALYYRAPYTSVKGVKPFLPAPAFYQENPKVAVNTNEIIDLTDKLQQDGTLEWQVPEGKWTVMRFGMRNNGAVTRPAPMPGLGFEADKFDTTAFNSHFENYIGKLIKKVGPRDKNSSGGWTMIHIDSWEMGAQNWTGHFREEFIKRCSYDPLKYLPVYSGTIVGSREISERFLWDIRQVSMELVLENHARHFKDLGRRNGFTLSIEPYDMNPTADLNLGAVADVPMCEFWSEGLGFNSSFSCIEATSIAHVLGRPVVAAEAFTADSDEKWTRYPETVKNQGDWAFCMGINKFVYHTFAHQPLDDKYRPGMTMGPYGVHWDRGQTWWKMANAYHEYISRCQFVLRQGKSVADILYLTPEGAPHVFRPPHSALEGDDVLPDKKGFSFDGCSPQMLMENADVADNCIVFPGGASYRVLVLSNFQTMTPELLKKLDELLKKGAVMVGDPPLKSPSLVGYPECDDEVKRLSMNIWNSFKTPEKETEISYGKGKLYWGGNYAKTDSTEIYPDYESTANLLGKLGVQEDFLSSGSLRYTHRIDGNRDIYFVSNRTDDVVFDTCSFRVASGFPEIWNPVTGETHKLPEFLVQNGRTSVPLKFEKAQSYFIIFDKAARQETISLKLNFPEKIAETKIEGSWTVHFDPEWGGPDEVIFDSLSDWTSNPNENIRYYSGTAVYTKEFDLPENLKSVKNPEVLLNLGSVKNMAHVKLNGKDLGVIWTSPWQVKVTGVLKQKNNKLEIEVVNLWSNRMIGDEQLPNDGVKNGEWPGWLQNNQPRLSGRYTFVPRQFYKKDSPLQPSGLLGPVTLYSR
ncbi:MAG: glycosyl hydrolase [Draconibacterium sp.]